MNMFGNLSTAGLEKAEDRLGGGGLFESGAYTGTIKLAYAGKSANSEAQSVTVHVDIDGQEFRETYWVTNKNNENFYIDKRDETKKHPLPGYTMVDDLCLLSTGAELSAQNIEPKVVKLYNFDEKKDVPTEVPMLVDLLGKPIAVGLLKQTVDKQKKDAGGVYRNTGETRDENIADKFFHAESHRTVTEIREGVETASFYPAWVEKNTGKSRNRSKGLEGKSGAPGGNRPALTGSSDPQAGASPKPSLFANG